MTEERRYVSIPEPAEPLPSIPVPEEEVEEVAVAPEAEPEGNFVEDVSDLTRVTREDIMGKRDGNSEPDGFSDLTELSEEDREDLFGVGEEEVMGEVSPPKPQPTRRFVRTTRRYIPPPPTGVRGIQ